VSMATLGLGLVRLAAAVGARCAATGTAALC
jgi:hypothetical protein